MCFVCLVLVCFRGCLAGCVGGSLARGWAGISLYPAAARWQPRRLRVAVGVEAGEGCVMTLGARYNCDEGTWVLG